MKPIILGTAGHIDHGKTSLVKALTGIDTDRLKEEQVRGITIELGFASLDLPSGVHVGIVDVPGHEKFVKNMVAGAFGIDLVVMVIAADEGIMPQTREHMEICTLLGIEHGLVALTKTDLVDEEFLELVQEEIDEFVQGTFLEKSPVIPVSAATGEGIQALMNAIDDVCGKVVIKPQTGIFRIPVDRVFTMKGFGTVVTGSLISGSIGIHENVMIYPKSIPTKVRGIQFHNRPVERAEAGMRTAINLQGIEKAALKRGDVIARPKTLIPAFMLDVSLTYLASNPKPIKNRSRIRFHTGTSEILGYVILLEKEELNPGESTVAQIRLDSEVAVVKGDHFVIRSYSPVRTIGGGTILNPAARKIKGHSPRTVEKLKRMLSCGPEDIISFHAKSSGFLGVSFHSLMPMTNLSEKHLEKIVQKMLSKKELLLLDREAKTYVHKDTCEMILEKIKKHLVDYHKKYPLKAGMPKEELKSKFPPTLGPRLYQLVIEGLSKDNKSIVVEEKSIRLASHRISLGQDHADIKKKIMERYAKSGLTPPYFKEIITDLKISGDKAKDVLALLVEEGKLVKVKEDLFFHAESIDNLKKRLVNFLIEKSEITTPQFKELTGVSRKYAIPLIEYFDSTNLTIRIGDIRKLRGR